MRYLIVFFLCASACLAQGTHHNDEFGFTIGIPSQWHATTENDWSNKIKAVSKKQFWSSKPLLILNPSGAKTLNVPSIIVHGIKLKRTTTSEAIADLKKNGSDTMTSSAENIAMFRVLGKNFNQYREEDTFYDYDSSKNCATAIILYQHNTENTYFTAAMSKCIGLKRVVDFRGYWKGANPEEFRQIFNGVIDSFEYDSDAAAPFGSSIEGRNLSEKILNKALKWGGIILTISIILGFVKMLLGR